jgi:ATP-binding cassette subfamily B protein
MVARYHGKWYSLSTVRGLCDLNKAGASLKSIMNGAQSLGLNSKGVRLSLNQLLESVPLPCILHWNQNHYVVLPPQKINTSRDNFKIKIADPSSGIFSIEKEIFLRSWIPREENSGVAILFEPSPAFYTLREDKRSNYWKYLFGYIRPYRSFLFQLLIGMVIESILVLAAPFLTQSLVDRGVANKDLKFIHLVLFSQVVVMAGTLLIGIVRNWLMLHMSARINISIVSDFLSKLMELPLRFFDTRVVGDIVQRISDHRRIEQFLSVTTLYTIFSIAHLLVFTIILGFYSKAVLLIFLIGSILSTGWIIYFLKKRRDVDYEKFQALSEGQSNVYEIIRGMQDIKVTGSEQFHRNGWKRNQEKIFKVNLKAMSISQFQTNGSNAITQLKNILISFVVARSVVGETMTLGMMLGVSYIVGMMNSPIDQLLGFFQTAQDADISLKRMLEIQSVKNEESEELLDVCVGNSEHNKREEAALRLQDLSFRYGGVDSPLVLRGINLEVPHGKVIAIVGASGSGKSTLIKLLLKYYEPTKGTIHCWGTPFNTVSPKSWRRLCGVVMSDGYIFSDTISANIALNEQVDESLLKEATKAACIDSFINELPLKYATMIGEAGVGISSGQRQRILIARAIYSQPDFLFLDEATNSLDASNERAIVENLNKFYEGRTVVVVAHRLSTVKYADQIVVLNHGRISEIGTHNELAELRGDYYHLVKNQLELEMET